MSLKDMYTSMDIFNSHHLLIKSIIILALTVLAGYIELRVFKMAFRRYEQKPDLYLNAFLWAIHKPVNALIWISGILLIGKLITLQSDFAKHLYSLKVFQKICLVTLFTWFLIRFTNRIEEKYLRLKIEEVSLILDQTTIQAIAQIIRVLIFTVALLIIFKSFFNVPLTGLWAVGGASSIVIGWAAKDLLANFFGALMIFLDRPFSLGDWIRSSDRQIEGCVEYIGWRLTRIRTFDKRSLYIPNSVFANISVENCSQMHCWRIRETISIRYEDINKVDDITKSIRAMLIEHPNIDKSLTCVVSLTNFSPYALDMIIYCFTDTRSWVSYLGIKQEIMINITRIIHDHGAEIAFPTQTLALPKQDFSSLAKIVRE